MNMHLSPNELRALDEMAQGAVARLFESAAASAARNTTRHAAPYSKTSEGRKRRAARKHAIARKREFLA